MARAAQLEPAVGRQHRRDARDELREAHLRLDDVELGGGVERLPKLDRLRAERIGELPQDAVHLFALLLLERDDLVVDLDRAERLEIEARAAARAAVDDAGNRRCDARP